LTAFLAQCGQEGDFCLRVNGFEGVSEENLEALAGLQFVACVAEVLGKFEVGDGVGGDEVLEAE